MQCGHHGDGHGRPPGPSAGGVVTGGVEGGAHHHGPHRPEVVEDALPVAPAARAPGSGTVDVAAPPAVVVHPSVVGIQPVHRATRPLLVVAEHPRRVGRIIGVGGPLGGVGVHGGTQTHKRWQSPVHPLEVDHHKQLDGDAQLREVGRQVHRLHPLHRPGVVDRLQNGGQAACRTVGPARGAAVGVVGIGGQGVRWVGDAGGRDPRRWSRQRSQGAGRHGCRQLGPGEGQVVDRNGGRSDDHRHRGAALVVGLGIAGGVVSRPHHQGARTGIVGQDHLPVQPAPGVTGMVAPRGATVGAVVVHPVVVDVESVHEVGVGVRPPSRHVVIGDRRKVVHLGTSHGQGIERGSEAGDCRKPPIGPLGVDDSQHLLVEGHRVEPGREPHGSHPLPSPGPVDGVQGHLFAAGGVVESGDGAALEVDGRSSHGGGRVSVARRPSQRQPAGGAEGGSQYQQQRHQHPGGGGEADGRASDAAVAGLAASAHRDRVPRHSSGSRSTGGAGPVRSRSGAGQEPVVTFGSLGRPSTRSPTMFRWISAVPPQMVSLREKKKEACRSLTG